MISEKKIRVTISRHIVQVLKSDCTDFDVTFSYLCNYIFEDKNFYIFKNTQIKNKLTKDNIVIQFNLNKKNRENYFSILNDYNITVEADFFRRIFLNYISNPRSQRERFLHKKNVLLIEEAIANKKQIELKFEDNTKIVTPYFIADSNLEIANYIFCYDENLGKFKNFKLKFLKAVFVTRKNSVSADTKFIKFVKNNFDPFLSYGEIVKIRLTKNGEKLFERISTNRPNVLKHENNIYTIEATEEKITRYFSYFFNEVEILEPLDLRKKYIKKLENTLNNYKK